MRSLMEPIVLAEELKEYRFKRNREKRRLTQREMAKFLGVPVYTYQRWEKALVRISPMMFAHLVRMKVVTPKKVTALIAR